MIGQEVGRYKIIDELGRGGMGVVYRAEHSLMGKLAVIKVLLPAFSSNDEAVNRFFNEAKAATAISHPGIVEIFDFGYHSDGSAFIVMELLQGETLAERSERVGKLGAQDALRIVRQVADALSAAHRMNIVHRDMKPDNVFLVPDREVAGGERAKILDFGIAKLSDKDMSGLVKTQAGAMIGTPTYMSPEQCEGAAEVDARSDIYSLGCILYEILTGRTVFTSPGIGGMLAAHLTTPPTPPTEYEPSIPAPVEALVLRMLAKNPADRPQTMEELYREIDSLTGMSASMSGPVPGSILSTMPGTGQRPAMATPAPGMGMRTPGLAKTQMSMGHGPAAGPAAATGPATSTGPASVHPGTAGPSSSYPAAGSHAGPGPVAYGPGSHAGPPGPQVAGGGGKGIWIALAAVVVLGGGGTGLYFALTGGNGNEKDTADAAPVAEGEIDAAGEALSIDASAVVASTDAGAAPIPDAAVAAAAIDASVVVASGTDAAPDKDRNEQRFDSLKRAAARKDYEKVIATLAKIDERSPFFKKAKKVHDKLRGQFVRGAVRTARSIAAKQQCDELAKHARTVGAVFSEAKTAVDKIQCTKKPEPTEDERLNAEGVALARSGKHAEALEKFQAAVTIKSRSTYLFNVCRTLQQLGQKVRAINTCELVVKSAKGRLKEKAERLILEMKLE